MEPRQRQVLKLIASGALALTPAEQKAQAADYGFTPAALRLAFERLAPATVGVDADSTLQVDAPRSSAGLLARTTLHLIDQVHACAGLPSLPLRFGEAQNTWGQLVLFADGKPRHIRVSRRSPFLPLALLHEFGHLLDFFLPLTGRCDAACLSSSAGGRAFVQAVEESRWYTQRKRTVAALGLTVEVACYHLSAREAFANAYTQWLVGRTASAPLSEGFRLLQQAEQSCVAQGLDCLPLSWADDDFAPIAVSIDRLFAPLLYEQTA